MLLFHLVRHTDLGAKFFGRLLLETGMSGCPLLALADILEDG